MRSGNFFSTLPASAARGRCVQWAKLPRHNFESQALPSWARVASALSSPIQGARGREEDKKRRHSHTAACETCGATAAWWSCKCAWQPLKQAAAAAWSVGWVGSWQRRGGGGIGKKQSWYNKGEEWRGTSQVRLSLTHTYHRDERGRRERQIHPPRWPWAVEWWRINWEERGGCWHWHGCRR